MPGAENPHAAAKAPATATGSLPPPRPSSTLLYNSDKTFIGRIERGFDLLGYHFDPDGLSVAKNTV